MKQSIIFLVLSQSKSKTKVRVQSPSKDLDLEWFYFAMPPECQDCDKVESNSSLNLFLSFFLFNENV